MTARFGARTRLSEPVSSWGKVPQSPLFGLSEYTASVTVQANASANTKGAWTEIIASTDFDTNWLYLFASTAAASADSGCLLDVGIGASGSEVVVIENMAIGFAFYTAANYSPFYFPIHIPAGSRLAYRLQHVTGSTNISIRTSLFDVGSTSPTSLITHGATTATSRGTNLPTNNTYVELVASTTQAYRAVIMVPTGGGLAAIAAEQSTYTLGMGAAGSEVALLDVLAASATNESVGLVPGVFMAIYEGYIPAGSRLAVKQSVGRTYRDVVIYGVPF